MLDAAVCDCGCGRQFSPRKRDHRFATKACRFRWHNQRRPVVRLRMGRVELNLDEIERSVRELRIELGLSVPQNGSA